MDETRVLVVGVRDPVLEHELVRERHMAAAFIGRALIQIDDRPRVPMMDPYKYYGTPMCLRYLPLEFTATTRGETPGFVVWHISGAPRRPCYRGRR